MDSSLLILPSVFPMSRGPGLVADLVQDGRNPSFRAGSAGTKAIQLLYGSCWNHRSSCWSRNRDTTRRHPAPHGNRSWSRVVASTTGRRTIYPECGLSSPSRSQAHLQGLSRRSLPGVHLGRQGEGLHASDAGGIQGDLHAPHFRNGVPGRHLHHPL